MYSMYSTLVPYVFNFTNVTHLIFRFIFIFDVKSSCHRSSGMVFIDIAIAATLNVYFDVANVCRFAIELIESNQDRLKAAIILKEKLDYNEQMIHHLILTATVSIKHTETTEKKKIWLHRQACCSNYSIFNINKIFFHRIFPFIFIAKLHF